MEKLKQIDKETPYFYQILNDLKYWNHFYKNNLNLESENLRKKFLELNDKFENLFHKFEKNWRNWTTNDICQWIKILRNHEFA